MIPSGVRSSIVDLLWVNVRAGNDAAFDRAFASGESLAATAVFHAVVPITDAAQPRELSADPETVGKVVLRIR
jgi:hypothetical protein